MAAVQHAAAGMGGPFGGRGTYVPRTGFEEETRTAMQPSASDSWEERWVKAKRQLTNVAVHFIRHGHTRGNMVRTEHGAAMDPTRAVLHTEDPQFACAAAVTVLQSYDLPYRLVAA